jgi:hypothetical protein
MMDSYSFEVAAKNAVIEMLEKRGIEAKIEDLQLVWFTHLLGNKKCLIYGPVMANLYAEVTYARDSDMCYVDMYMKMDHKDIHGFDLNFEVTPDKRV